MKSKNQKNQKKAKKEKDNEKEDNKKNNKVKDNKDIDKSNNELNNKDANLDKNNDKKDNEFAYNNVKRASPWIFIYGKDLQGFHTAFILMIIFPISVFYIIRNILDKYNFTRNQQDTYGLIGMLIAVWIILVTYIVYYFRNDFYTVFCQKKEKEKEE